MNQVLCTREPLMYKSVDDLPITFGPSELAVILGISRNKAYEIANRTDFPTYRMGKKIIISKKHFLIWMDEQFAGWMPLQS